MWQAWIIIIKFVFIFLEILRNSKLQENNQSYSDRREKKNEIDSGRKFSELEFAPTYPENVFDFKGSLEKKISDKKKVFR